MTILINEGDEISFLYLKELLSAVIDKVSFGNLSVHLSKLEEAGYIEIYKNIVDKKVRTTYKITELGIEKFYHYIQDIENMIAKVKTKQKNY